MAMKSKMGPLAWVRHIWMALGLRGRLVIGYSALFAVLLIGIAFGETTVVRQILIDDRRAALPAATNDLASLLKGPSGVKPFGLDGSMQIVSGDKRRSIQVVTGNPQLLMALFSAKGTMVSKAVGADVRNVDPRQLLDTRYATGDSPAPATYQRTVGATAYLVYVRLMPVPFMAISMVAPPVSDGAGVVTTGPVPVVTRSTLLVAESLQPVDDTVNTLLFITLLASGLGLLLAASAGLAVARRALRPLERMTATAQAIAAGGDGALDRRLNLPGQGDEVGLLAATFDQMLDRIQATIAERVRSETRLRHFAADASHELRTPLAALSGYTEVLLMGGKDDPATAAHVLRQMEGELGRMNRLVADLLTLARLEAGLPVHTRVLPVAPVLDGLAEETRLLAARAGRDLVITVAAQPEAGQLSSGAAALPSGANEPRPGANEPRPERVDDLALRADPDRLHQILLNLLHNAVKFTPDGGCITLAAARRNGMVVVSVTDTGAGIASEELPLLFERFYRSDQARARGSDVEAGGAGLGLAIAQGLAQAQRGHVEVSSTPGSGSTFTVVLPAATPSDRS